MNTQSTACESQRKFIRNGRHTEHDLFGHYNASEYVIPLLAIGPFFCFFREVRFSKRWRFCVLHPGITFGVDQERRPAIDTAYRSSLSVKSWLVVDLGIADILSTAVPPIGVFLVAGCGADLLINILLTILG